MHSANAIMLIRYLMVENAKLLRFTQQDAVKVAKITMGFSVLLTRVWNGFIVVVYARLIDMCVIGWWVTCHLNAIISL